MIKKYVWISFYFLLGMMGTPHLMAQNATVTIGSGTSGSYYAPYCNASRNVLVEMLYPQELVGSAGRIDTIAFRCSVLYSSEVIDNASLNIYMGHTSAQNLAEGYVGRETLQLVFSGTNYSNGGLSGWEKIALQNPYYYDGTDNLVIVVERTSTDYSWNINYLYSTADSCCRYAYSDTDPAWASIANPPSASTISANRPNLRLSINTSATAPCRAPAGVTPTYIDETSLNATIVPHAGDSLWSYRYGVVTGSLSGSITTADTLIALSDLTPGALYRLEVRTVCAPGDTGTSYTLYFNTQCAPYVAADTFYTAFEMAEGYQTGRGNLAKCWTVGNLQSASSIPYVNTLLGTTLRFLDIDGRYQVTEQEWPLSPIVDARDSSYAILPEMFFDGGISNYRLNFTLSKGQNYYSDTLQVGVVTDPADLSTFHLVAQVAATRTTTPIEVLFNNYTGPDGRMAFLGRCTPGATNQIFEFYIDEVMVSAIPACVMPTALSVEGIDTAHVTLNWHAESEESQWQVRYRALGDNSWTTVMASSLPFTVSGLDDGVDYEFCVRAYCGASHTSQWTTPVSATTRCRPVHNYPWMETFNTAWSGNPWSNNCWENVNNSFHISNTRIGTNNSPHLYAYSTVSTITLPTFRLHRDSLYTFRMAMARYATISGGIYVIANHTDTLGFVNQLTSEPPFESTNGWYFYEFPIPRMGDTAAITLYANHGGAVVLDNLSVQAVSGCIMPNLPAADSVTGSSAHITWSTLGSETVWQLRYRTHADTTWHYLDSIATPNLILDSLQPSTQYAVQVRALCDDTLASEWSWPVQFVTYCAPITDFTWTEDFQSGGNMTTWNPSCWATWSSEESDDLVFGTGQYDETRTRVLYILTNETSTNLDAVTSITLPPFDIPTSSYHFSLDMQRYSSLYHHGSNPYGGLYVIANSDTLAYIPCLRTQSGTNVGTESSDGWYTYDFSIPHAGFTRITLSAVTKKSDFLIDNLSIYRHTNCTTPANFSATDVTDTSATLSWTGSGSSWRVKYKETDSSSFTVLNVSTTNVTLGGLAPGRRYSAYVCKLCADGDSSNWAVPVGFSTQFFSHSITVANGTIAASMPVYGRYASYAIHSQSIYPASMLSSIVGDTIIALHYFVHDGDNHNTWDDATFTVKLSTTAQSTLTSFDTTATTTYTGTLVANPDEGMTIIFDTPFVYHGGNLVVQFDKPLPSTSYYVKFYCMYQLQSGLFWYSGSSSASSQYHLPQCQIYYNHTYYTAAALPNDSTRGSVTGGGVFEYGDVATFTATSRHGYYFSHWSNGASDSTISVTISSDTTLIAYFQPIEVAVATLSADSTMGAVYGGGVYNYGDSVTLVAHAYHGHEFVQWDNDCADSILSFIATHDTSFTASFQRSSFVVTAVSNDSTMGNVSGGGIYLFGDTVALSAHPLWGYEFLHWDNGLTDSIIDIVVACDTIVTAYFQPATADIVINNSTPESGTTAPVPGTYTIQIGQTFSIEALPNEGCFFDYWSDSRTDTTITSPIYAFELTADDLHQVIEIGVHFSSPVEGIATPSTAEPIITTRGGNIVITNVLDQEVCIFDCFGRRLAQRRLPGGQVSVPVPSSGVYFVRVGQHSSQRIVVVR